MVMFCPMPANSNTSLKYFNQSNCSTRIQMDTESTFMHIQYAHTSTYVRTYVRRYVCTYIRRYIDTCVYDRTPQHCDLVCVVHKIAGVPYNTHAHTYIPTFVHIYTRTCNNVRTRTHTPTVNYDLQTNLIVNGEGIIEFLDLHRVVGQVEVPELNLAVEDLNAHKYRLHMTSMVVFSIMQSSITCPHCTTKFPTLSPAYPPTSHSLILWDEVVQKMVLA